VADDDAKLTSEEPRLPSPSEILDAVAKGKSAVETLRQFLGKEPEHVGEDRLGDLSPSHSPSRGR